MNGSGLRICLNALFLQNDHLGGIGHYTHRLAEGMRRRHPDWEITLMTHAWTAHNFKDIPGLRLREIRIRSRLWRTLFLHFLFPLSTKRYHLVHSVGNYGPLFSRAAQVITIHDCYEHVSRERYGWFKRRLMRIFISVSTRKAARVITDSLSSRRDIITYYPHTSQKLSVIYLGNKFPVRAPENPGTRAGFIFVGTIEPGKNLTLVLEAFARFQRVHAGRLRVIGAMGWKQSHLPGLIRGLGIEGDVEFMGYVPEDRLRALYGESLALIQASNYEGFGLPVIEAMACGCPAIVARNSGLVEAGGDAALFFRPNDRDDLLKQMQAVQSDIAMRDEHIRLGFSHAAKFDWEKTGLETERVYEAVVPR